MKKANPKIRWHVSDAERKQIREMTLSGVQQSVIARALKIGAPSVSKAQQQMKLATRLPVRPVPEKKIMELFEKGWGGYKIARHLGLSAPKVYAVAHRNNFRRKDGSGHPTPVENERRFIEGIKNREGYIKTLAKKYGVGIIKAGRLARATLNCSEFRPGACKPPLSSNFPQKHFDPKMGTPVSGASPGTGEAGAVPAPGPTTNNEFVALIDCIFGDKLPFAKEFDVLAVAAMLTGFLRVVPDFRGQPPAVLHQFALGLVEAINCVRANHAQRPS